MTENFQSKIILCESIERTGKCDLIGCRFFHPIKECNKGLNCSFKHKCSFWHPSQLRNIWYLENLNNEINKKLQQCEEINKDKDYEIANLKMSLDDKNNITSFDIDDKCAQIKLFDNVHYKTNDIAKHDPKSYDVLICTSCEHITDDLILTWIKRRKENSLVILQSNDYFHIKDHINCKASLSQFKSSLIKKAKKKKINIEITNSYELEFSNYTRFMLFLT